MAQRSLNRRSRRDEVEDDYEGPDTDSVEEDEEPPRRGRGRSRLLESLTDEEDPRSRRTRSRRQEPDEDEEEPEEDRKPRSRRSREESFDKGSREGSSRGQRPSSSAIGKGWGGYKSVKATTKSADYVENYRLPEEQAELIKFLDDAPFAVYNEHWIDSARKKSWTCIGEDCPLCNTGDRAKTYAMFNVIDMREGQEPKVAPLKAGSMVAELLEEFANDKKTGPLNRVDQYFSIQKKGGGKKGRVQVIINPVKARDLDEDWDTDVLTEAEIEEDYMPDMYSEDDVVTFAARKTMQEIADDLD